MDFIRCIYILWISLIEFVAHKWARAHIYTQGPYNAKLWLPWRPHRGSSSAALLLLLWLLERRKSLKERGRILVAYMENYSRIIAWLATNIHTYIHTKSWFLTRHAKSTTHAYSCFSLITTMYRARNASHCYCKKCVFYLCVQIFAVSKNVNVPTKESKIEMNLARFAHNVLKLGKG